MESLIGLVNRIQSACTVLGDHGGGGDSTFSSLWEALPSVAVVGGQVLLFSLSSFNFFFLLNFDWIWFYFYFCVIFRVLENLQFLRVLLVVTFFLEDLVSLLISFFLNEFVSFRNFLEEILIEFWIFLTGIVTRRPLVLQLHKTDDGSQEYAEFLHMPNRRIPDFGL